MEKKKKSLNCKRQSKDRSRKKIAVGVAENDAGTRTMRIQKILDIHLCLRDQNLSINIAIL